MPGISSVVPDEVRAYGIEQQTRYVFGPLLPDDWGRDRLMYLMLLRPLGPARPRAPSNACMTYETPLKFLASCRLWPERRAWRRTLISDHGRSCQSRQSYARERGIMRGGCDRHDRVGGPWRHRLMKRSDFQGEDLYRGTRKTWASLQRYPSNKTCSVHESVRSEGPV